MRKGSKHILKFKKLASEQRGIFNILYKKDAVDLRKYYEQSSLGSGNNSYNNLLVNTVALHILKGCLERTTPSFRPTE